MLEKIKGMKRYRLVVMQARKPRRDNTDDILIEDGDTFYGYSYHHHVVGKHFDLWFKPRKFDDPENFIAFGRIMQINGGDTSRRVFFTKNVQFMLEDADVADINSSSESKRTKSSKRSEDNDSRNIPGATGRGCNKNIGRGIGGGHGAVPSRKSDASNLD